MRHRSCIAIVAACLLLGVGASCAGKGTVGGPGRNTVSFCTSTIRPVIKVPKSLTGFDDALNSGDMGCAASIIVRFEGAPWRSEEVRAILGLIRQLDAEQKQSLVKAVEGVTKAQGKLLLPRLVLVDLYVCLGQADKAAGPVSELISLSKGAESVLEGIGSSLHSAPGGEGVESLRKQIRAPHDLAQSAQDHAARGERDAALADAQTVLKRWPRNRLAILLVSRVFQQFEQWNDAIAAEELRIGMQTTPPDDSSYYYLGDMYLKIGHPTDAVKAYKRAIAQAKTDSMKLESFRGIIRACVAMKRYDNAAEAVIESDRCLTDRNMALQVVATTIIDGLDEQALASALESALRGKSGLPASRYLLGHLLLKAGKISEARETFIAAAKEANGDATTLASIADRCRGEEALRGLALQLGATASELHPDDQHAAMSSAQAYLDSGRKAEAIAAAKSIVQKWPNESLLLQGAAGILKATQQWDDAISAQQQAIAVAKDAGVTKQSDLGDAYRKGISAAMQYELGEIYREAGRYPEAVTAYKQSLAGKPDNFAACSRLWEIASLQGASDSPAIEAQMIIDADMGKVNRTLLSLIMSDLTNNATSKDATRLAHYRGVADALTAALRQQPDRVDSFLVLAALDQVLGRGDEARSIIQKMLPRATDPSVLSSLAAIYSNSGDRTSAVSIQERVVAIDGSSYTARWSLGIMLTNAGMNDRAVEQAASMIRDWPTDPWALFYAGSIYQIAGRTDDAIEVFRNSMAADDEVIRNTGKPVERAKWSCLLGISGIYDERKDFARERQALDEMLSIAKDEAARQYVQGRIAGLQGKASDQ